MKIKKPYLDQTKKKSTLIENAGGMLFGLSMQATATYLLINTLFRVTGPMDDVWVIPLTILIFTGISFARSYITRRFFNWLSKK